MALGKSTGYFAPVNNAFSPFVLEVYATGLTPGTQYWIDLALQAITGGTCNLFSMTVPALEH